MPSRRAHFVIGSWLVLLVVAAPYRSGAASYPVKASANGRYLVDQADVPFLMVGDSPQALMVNISESEADAFFADRSEYGFNTVWINLLRHVYRRSPGRQHVRRHRPVHAHAADVLFVRSVHTERNVLRARGPRARRGRGARHSSAPGSDRDR